MLNSNLSIKHTSQTKWDTELSNTEHNWKNIYINTFKSVLDPKIKWMQYSIIFRNIPTNVYLTKVKIKTDKTCDMCKIGTETAAATSS